MAMTKIIRQHLQGLTIAGLLIGLFCGLSIEHRVSRSSLTREEFFRETERGAHMPLIITNSGELDQISRAPGTVRQYLQSTSPLLVKTPATFIIGDQPARSFYGCRDGLASETWFDGDLTSKSEAPKSASNTADHGQVTLVATGVVKTCTVVAGGERTESVLARGVTVAATLDRHDSVSDASHFQKMSALVSYFDTAAGMYITFLLMLFVPTLAISLLKSLVDPNRTSFRSALGFFLVSSFVASTVGAVAGGLSQLINGRTLQFERLKELAESFAGKTASIDYDMHPVLSQIVKIVPTNPLAALTDPNGNSGLQVAFIVVLVGLVLAAIPASDLRNKIARYLDAALSVIIRNPAKEHTALSDYADLITPIGVFFVSAGTSATLDLNAWRELAGLFATIMVALALHVVGLVIWTVRSRVWKMWLEQGFFPAMPGLITAFATASSYAALPFIHKTPLLFSSSARKGVFDLGTTVNKNGTAIYLSASAAFFIFRDPASSPVQLIPIIIVSALAGTAIAGLPFAAIFGLRLVIGTASGLPTGLAWLILPMDAAIDRFVTVVNVFANLVGCSDPERKEPAVAAVMQVQ